MTYFLIVLGLFVLAGLCTLTTESKDTSNGVLKYTDPYDNPEIEEGAEFEPHQSSLDLLARKKAREEMYKKADDEQVAMLEEALSRKVY